LTACVNAIKKINHSTAVVDMTCGGLSSCTQFYGILAKVETCWVTGQQWLLWPNFSVQFWTDDQNKEM